MEQGRINRSQAQKIAQLVEQKAPAVVAAYLKYIAEDDAKLWESELLAIAGAKGVISFEGS